jgi:hypothetical protein
MGYRVEIICAIDEADNPSFFFTDKEKMTAFVDTCLDNDYRVELSSWDGEDE